MNRLHFPLPWLGIAAGIGLVTGIAAGIHLQAKRDAEHVQHYSVAQYARDQLAGQPNQHAVICGEEFRTDMEGNVMMQYGAGWYAVEPTYSLEPPCTTDSDCFMKFGEAGIAKRPL